MLWEAEEGLDSINEIGYDEIENDSVLREGSQQRGEGVEENEGETCEQGEDRREDMEKEDDGLAHFY